MRVAVVGAGYVGSVTAAALAGFGHRVWLVENSPAKWKYLRAGRPAVREPGLAAAMRRAVRARRLRPTASLGEAVRASELALICVGTPSRPGGGADLGPLRNVLRDLAAELARDRRPYAIVLRSTAPYGRVERELLPGLRRRLGRDFGRRVRFAVNPDFTREGSGLRDFLDPPFVVIGADDARTAGRLKRLYRPLARRCRVVAPGTASLLKYACNAFHAMKVAFANEVAGLGAAFGADAAAAMELFRQDGALNLSGAYLRPGFAYGGPCLGKDLRALLSGAPRGRFPLLAAVEASNAAVVRRAAAAVLRGGFRKVALLGVTFKEGTDDLRDSPWLELAARLLKRGRSVRIFDPDVDLKALHGKNLRYIERKVGSLGRLLAPSLGRAVRGADLLVLAKRGRRFRPAGRRGRALFDPAKGGL